MSQDPLLYYKQVNPDLLWRIPVTAERVVEIGCGTGALGYEYKRINPDVTYIGVELDKTAAAIATKNIDKVLTTDIGNIDPTKDISPPKSVDCLVFGDVLEHLTDPEHTLRSLLPLLNNNGIVLACIPNVQHWSSILNLLHGHWPQEEQGLFDKTHLRWFTKAEIIKLVKRLGLSLEELKPRIFNYEKAQSFVKALEPGLVNLGLNEQRVLDGVAPLQYVLRATLKQHTPISINGLMLRPQAGLNDVRMIQPLRSIASIPAIQVSLSTDSIELVSADSQLPRIMIWQRQLLSYEEDLPKLKSCLDSGYIMISEFDDDPSHWPQVQANKHLQFTAMHAIQVSTEPLANSIKKYCPEVKVFPNAIDRLHIVDVDKKWEGVDLRTPLRVFFGALNRKNDWASWMPCLNNAIQVNPNRYEFHIVHDKMFFDELSSIHKIYYPTCNYKSYINILSQCHINLLPLLDNQFNRMKSDLKFVETAGCGVAAIASPTTYSESVDNNKTGVIISSPEDLIDVLNLWQEDPNHAKNIAINAHKWVRTKRLQKYQTEDRIAWYRSLWDRRNELTQALKQRVPELN